MSDVPGAAMTAMVGPQTVIIRPGRHELAQVGDGFPPVLMRPFAGASPHLGAVRGHRGPFSAPDVWLPTRFDRSPLATRVISGHCWPTNKLQ